MKKIKLLIVDDSALIRTMFLEILANAPDIEVIGTAVDPFDAREKIKLLNPDVITLDIEMPKMDGISFLEKIMSLRPMPVIMVSTLTEKGADITIRALEIGAVDFLAKPNIKSQEDMVNFSNELHDKIRTAASIRIIRHNIIPAPIKSNVQPSKIKSNAPVFIAIGSSTGGVETLTEILTSLPKNTPPIVITQHMPAGFTSSFANRLASICEIDVKESVDMMPLKNGLAIIAAGGKQLKIAQNNGQLICRVANTPPVNNHNPSVDVLFNSVAEVAGSKAMGIILTGMGKDGANGLLKMREAGAYTIGQDEYSCVVYGMPKAAYEIGAVTKVLKLSEIAPKIKEICFT